MSIHSASKSGRFGRKHFAKLARGEILMKVTSRADWLAPCPSLLRRLRCFQVSNAAAYYRAANRSDELRESAKAIHAKRDRDLCSCASFLQRPNRKAAL